MDEILIDENSWAVPPKLREASPRKSNPAAWVGWSPACSKPEFSIRFFGGSDRAASAKMSESMPPRAVKTKVRVVVDSFSWQCLSIGSWGALNVPLRPSSRGDPRTADKLAGSSRFVGLVGWRMILPIVTLSQD
ncbi:MAG: hypothetical protein ABS79_07625 [Planctomycetes bacterium SCN 63-9]|nr:MAG: hypothetical protein ABS79_07625 [Planctomycetes bacterium SCN 63-9]